jgi:hypothetical protein
MSNMADFAVHFQNGCQRENDANLELRCNNNNDKCCNNVINVIIGLFSFRRSADAARYLIYMTLNNV